MAILGEASGIGIFRRDDTDGRFASGTTSRSLFEVAPGRSSCSLSTMHSGWRFDEWRKHEWNNESRWPIGCLLAISGPSCL